MINMKNLQCVRIKEVPSACLIIDADVRRNMMTTEECCAFKSKSKFRSNKIVLQIIYLAH